MENVYFAKSIVKKVWKPILFVCFMLVETKHIKSILPKPKIGTHDGAWIGKIPGLDGAGHAHYEGQTRNGRMHGLGKLTLTDGTTYEGEFFLGEIAGNGKVKYPDDSVYDGPIRRWQQYGVGQLTLPDGTVLITNASDKSKHPLS